MKGKWDLKDLDVIHAIQVLVWCAFRAYDTAIQSEMRNPGKAMMVRDIIDNMITGLTARGIIYRGDVRYNEELWPPAEVEPLQICEIKFSPDASVGGFILRIDFFKGIKEGVTLANPEGGWPILDVLNVEYELE